MNVLSGTMVCLRSPYHLSCSENVNMPHIQYEEMELAKKLKSLGGNLQKGYDTFINLTLGISGVQLIFLQWDEDSYQLCLIVRS